MRHVTYASYLANMTALKRGCLGSGLCLSGPRAASFCWCSCL